MTRTFATASNEHPIFAALELSKNSWLLAIQSPERAKPSLHPIKGGDAERLMAKLDAARERVAKATGQMQLCCQTLMFRGLGSEHQLN